MITVETTKTLQSLTKLISSKEKAVNRALKVSAMEYALFMKESITRHQSSGREYRRRTVVHKASAPGYAPNSDTGFLASSITVSRRIRNSTIEVIVGARYARALEFGTKKMRKRPFVLPARQALAFKIGNRIREAMNAS